MDFSIHFPGEFDFVVNSHLFLLPPSFVGSDVAFDIKYLGVFLSIRDGSHWLISPFWLFRGLSSALTEDTCQKPK